MGNLNLNSGGWVATSDLLKAIRVKYPEFTRSDLIQLVDTDDKQRYQFKTITCNEIRASQGHSIEVDLQLLKATPPTVLYHGTKTSALDSIFTIGLSPMKRRYVHLSSSYETAAIVANRRSGGSVILTINTANAFADGINFYLADNGVWLADAIPARYILKNIHYLEPA